MTSLDKVDEFSLERHLLTSGLPDPDLLIRTSGEKRVRWEGHLVHQGSRWFAEHSIDHIESLFSHVVS